MRLTFIFAAVLLLNGCSLFGTYTWSHPQKTAVAQAEDKSECQALASVVYTSPDALLKLAQQGPQPPNKGVEADCLVEKGFKRVRVKTTS
ncbi:MAG: hypothetical protein ACPG47_03700 [Leucothrix sp.]